jgi:hypothetical protein
MKFVLDDTHVLCYETIPIIIRIQRVVASVVIYFAFLNIVQCLRSCYNTPSLILTGPLCRLPFQHLVPPHVLAVDKAFAPREPVVLYVYRLH